MGFQVALLGFLTFFFFGAFTLECPVQLYRHLFWFCNAQECLVYFDQQNSHLSIKKKTQNRCKRKHVNLLYLHCRLTNIDLRILPPVLQIRSLKIYQSRLCARLLVFVKKFIRSGFSKNFSSQTKYFLSIIKICVEAIFDFSKVPFDPLYPNSESMEMELVISNYFKGSIRDFPAFEIRNIEKRTFIEL